jgi:hypothetical protein
MFCFSGLTPDQVDRLVREFHIYMTRDGRIRYTCFSKMIKFIFYILIYILFTFSILDGYIWYWHKLFQPVIVCITIDSIAGVWSSKLQTLLVQKLGSPCLLFAFIKGIWPQVRHTRCLEIQLRVRTTNINVSKHRRITSRSMIIQKHKATFHESCCAEEKMNVLATTSPHFTYQHFFLYKRKEKKRK